MVRAGIGGSGGSVLVCGARSVGRTQLVAQRSWLPQSFFNNARPIPHWHDARMRAGSGDSMLLDASPSFWACQKFHRSPESPHPPGSRCDNQPGFLMGHAGNICSNAVHPTASAVRPADWKGRETELTLLGARLKVVEYTTQAHVLVFIPRVQYQ